ncbi:MAG: hypothetical protein M1832_005754 [Thelocarpon impressellum]|nr:MAG: hypothetical protein M1832_005754 [Thelocarpon impressellum]
MASSAPHEPLIAIVGATGTGKSQLAVQLATRFNGEIINGDAMQLYDGLPIITNKIPENERNGRPHHLLGCVGLDGQAWQVGVFTKRALGVIQEIRSRGRLPVLVGGTHYYTQSLLFEDALVSSETQQDARTASPHEPSLEAVTTSRFPVLDGPTQDILNELREVDPVMADRWHPNDRRKIRRSLEIYLSSGRRASDVYEEQSRRRQDQNGDLGVACEKSGTRFPTLVFWVHAEPDVLRARLDDRVDAMVSAGLLSEVRQLETFLQNQVHGENDMDQSRGIWAAIGYKEFKTYLRHTDDPMVSHTELEILKGAAVEQMKAATRQYAKRQVRWIRIKLSSALATAGVSDRFFLLDGSDVASWSDDVEQLAGNITSAFLQAEPLPSPSKTSRAAESMFSLDSRPDMSRRRDLWAKTTCDVCDITTVTGEDWAKHLKSRGHKKATKIKSSHGEILEARPPDGAKVG